MYGPSIDEALSALRVTAHAHEVAAYTLAVQLDSLLQSAYSVSPEHIEAAGGYRALVALLHMSRATAETAARVVSNLSFGYPESRVAITEAGGIAPLVAMLAPGAEEAHGAGALGFRLNTEAAANAAGALGVLAASETSRDAIRQQGGIPPLVALLASGADSEAAQEAAGALCNLAHNNDANRDAICAAGAIPRLVKLLSAGVDTSAAAHAAGALRNLALDAANLAAIREAGGIPRLVSLLSAGPESEAARRAAAALANMACDGAFQGPVLSAVSDRASPPADFPELVDILHDIAAAQLDKSLKELPALRRAIVQANSVQLAPSNPAFQRARARLGALEAAEETARVERRTALGLDGVETPGEYMCPISFEVMRDPVVASDGHSYERKSIEQVLDDTAVSPMTREPLTPYLFPNRALRKRIEEHEAEQEELARRARANQRGGTPRHGGSTPRPSTRGGGVRLTTRRSGSRERASSR